MDPRERLLNALRGQPVDRPPVWFMRQAGRYQPEYRALRQQLSLLDLIHNPALAAEITCLPVRQLGVDAAILFSDITVPLEALHIPFRLEERIGPVIPEPLRDPAQIAELGSFDASALPFLAPTIARVRAELPETALIGFAGAPFTLASYLVEGGPSRRYLETKRLMWQHPEAWSRLMDVLADATVAYLEAQIAAGVDAVQVFDSWVGALGADDYQERVLPWMRRIFSASVVRQVPTIYFGVGTAGLLEAMASAGASALGIDWRTDIAQVVARLGREIVIQGNLDPAALLAPAEVLDDKVRRILAAGRQAAGHVFNLGHGVHPETSPAALQQVVARVKQWGGRNS